MGMKREGDTITCDCGFSFQRGHSGKHDCEDGLRAQVAKLTAALEAKDARAVACVNAFEGIETDRIAGKTLGEFLAGEVRLNKAEPKQDGSFGFTFSGFAIQMMAEAFAEQFKEAGAVNYLELLFQHDELGPLTVTMQRVEGLTPTQKLAAAEQKIEVMKVEAVGESQRTASIFEAKNHWAERARTAEQALKEEKEQSTYYEAQMWHFHSLAEVEAINNAEHQKQIIADGNEILALERRLQQPALADVIAERQRQISAEGWTPEHDDEHDNNELAFAAGCYAIYAGATKRQFPNGEYAPPEWPWNASFWRPSTARRDLVKAGALILAEIERLDRATAKGE